MSPLAEYTISALLIIGGAFTLIGAIGLARLPDFYPANGSTKATTPAWARCSVRWSFRVLARASLKFDHRIPVPDRPGYHAGQAAMHIGVKTMDHTRGKPWDQ